MNTKKIEERLKAIADLNSQDSLTSSEYLVCVANQLFAFGKAGLATHTELQGLNFNDANQIELALNRNPDNVFLAAILQGHAILYWANLIGD